MNSVFSLEKLLSRETGAQLRRMELRARRQINADSIGIFQSAFRGSGLVFSDLREYYPGDDVKHIHWKATARANRPYVKTYHEERQLRVMLAIDTSASTFTGAPRTRAERALEFAAIVSLIAQKSGDQIGLCMFDEQIRTYMSPSRKPSQFKRIVLALLEGSGRDEKTNLKRALDEIYKREKKNALIFLLSDFVDRDYSHQLKVLCLKHDVVGVLLSDELDQHLPDCGLVQYRDSETGKTAVFDTSSPRARLELSKLHELRLQRIQKELRTGGGEMLRLSEQPIADLSRLMSRRMGAS